MKSEKKTFLCFSKNICFLTILYTVFINWDRCYREATCGVVNCMVDLETAITEMINWQLVPRHGFTDQQFYTSFANLTSVRHIFSPMYSLLCVSLPWFSSLSSGKLRISRKKSLFTFSVIGFHIGFGAIQGTILVAAQH